MPTYQRLPRFDIDWETLTPAERQRFRAAVGRFIEDLEAGRPFRAGLRVKGVQGTANIMEMTFAPDGRATWQFGTEVRPGEPHVVWRRIGTHAIFRSPRLPRSGGGRPAIGHPTVSHMTHDNMRHMRTPAPALLPLFRSELQARILTRLLLDDDEIGMSELARDLGAPQATVYREASRLVEAGVLVDRWIGRTRMVSANRANPAFAPLRELMEVVYGPKALLQAALADVTGIDEALIFGSWAARYRGQNGAAPGDIDLLVIGDPDVDALHLAVSTVEAHLHREVNFVVITPDTWAAREDDPFLAGVSAGPTVVVAGVEP